MQLNGRVAGFDKPAASSSRSKRCTPRSCPLRMPDLCGLRRGMRRRSPVILAVVTQIVTCFISLALRPSNPPQGMTAAHLSVGERFYSEDRHKPAAYIADACESPGLNCPDSLEHRSAMWRPRRHAQAAWLRHTLSRRRSGTGRSGSCPCAGWASPTLVVGSYALVSSSMPAANAPSTLTGRPSWPPDASAQPRRTS